MKYMLLVYSDEKSWTDDERTACIAESSALCHELNAKGQFQAASPLHPVATAMSVRIRDGQRLTTTGPFAETTEQLGGYFVIDVPNLDEAITISGRLPTVKKGTVEIRPILELPGLPASGRFQPQAGQKKFMLMCYDDEQYWNDVGKEAHYAAMMEAVQLAHELDARGQYVSASPLHPVATATSVRVRNGKRNVTDGPFAETREVLGGYYVLSLKDLDEAIAIAARHPGARAGTVEIRAIQELPDLPEGDATEIVSSRDFPFSREDIFAAFANPTQLARWWGPDGFRNTFEQFEFRPQGSWKFVMHGPDGKDYPNTSVFETVTPERIVINHASAPKFVMTVTLDELTPGRTRMIWRMRFETVELRNQIAKVVVGCNEENFDRLTNELKTSAAS